MAFPNGCPKNRKRLAVLLVEDDHEDASIFRRYAKQVSTYRLEIDHEEDPKKLDECLGSRSYSLVFLDQKLGRGITGLDTLKRIKRWWPLMPVLVLTGTGDEKTAVEMMRNGAMDYLTKETFNPEILERAVRYALKQQKLAIRDLRAQEALRQSELRYRTLFESAPVGIAIQTVDGRHVEANETMLHMMGYSKDGAGHICIEDRCQHPRDWDLLVKCVEETGFVRGLEVSFKGKDGRCHEARLNATKLVHGANDLLVVIAEDITDKKQLEARLFQSQRMESIGTLAGGIAHNFNNVLMGIQGRTSLMMMDMDPSHPDFRHLRAIEEHVRTASCLTKDLLGFARGGKYEAKPTDLNRLIKHEIEMFGQTRKEIAIRGKYARDLWAVEVDQGQVSQVLLNILVNAWQALPGGGTVYVKTENVTLESGEVKPFSLHPGPYVRLSITDTGPGMDKETRERVFEPFFTTKEPGNGTGLGLASAYGIIKNHGGFIQVFSEPGKGTSFHIHLPASKKPIGEEKQSLTETIRGVETILFVDDEEMVVDVAQELLERLGYTVLVCTTGKQAVEIYEENIERTDLVILDMIMPDMSGGETYDRLKAMNPDVKVLLSSGYSIDGLARKILDRGCIGFIQKPFSMTDVSIKVREALDGDV